jgi:hypothetical protein
MLNIRITTHVVYKNDKISISYDTKKDYYSITANENLKKGTFILLEHVLTSKNSEDLMFEISQDQNLMKTLYPRGMPDASSMEEALLREKAYRENKSNEKNPVDMFSFLASHFFESKLHYNFFKFNDGRSTTAVLGNAISKFNHNCKPNCFILPFDMFIDTEYYGIWSLKDIDKGDELTINYSNSNSVSDHNESKKLHNFSCSCSDDFIRAIGDKAAIKANLKIYKDWRENDFRSFVQMIQDYSHSDIGKVVAQKRRDINVSSNPLSCN